MARAHFPASTQLTLNSLCALTTTPAVSEQILEERQQLTFNLQQQRLIELIRRGEVEQALEFAQEYLAPRGEENVRRFLPHTTVAVCMAIILRQQSALPAEARGCVLPLHPDGCEAAHPLSFHPHRAAAGVSARTGEDARSPRLPRRVDEPAGDPAGARAPRAGECGE